MLDAAKIHETLRIVAELGCVLEKLGGTSMHTILFQDSFNEAERRGDKRLGATYSAATLAAYLAHLIGAATQISVWQDGDAVVVRFSPGKKPDSTPE